MSWPRPSFRSKDLLLALGSTSVFLVAGEASLRLAGLPKSEVLSVSRDPRFHDEHFAGPRPAWMEEDVDLLWRWKPNQRIVERRDEIGMHWGYRTNSRGFRGDEHPRNPGRPLVVCGGDSVTAGYGVGDEDSYPTLLRQRLRCLPGLASAEVLNLGVYGYSSEQGRIVLRRALREWRPDIVIVEYGINDNAITVYPDASLIGEEGIVRRLQRLLTRSRLYRALREPIVRMKLRRRAAAQGVLGARVSPERYAENLRAIVAWSRAIGAEPVFLSPTSKWEWGVKPHAALAHPERILTRHEMHVYRNINAAVAAELGVRQLALPVLSGLVPESAGRFPDWCHPDPEGLCLMLDHLVPMVQDAARTGPRR